jgi:putative cardiolipin synthase
VRTLCLLLAAACWLAGCGTLPLDLPRPPTTAWPSPEGSPLARAYAPQLAAHAGQSGLHALPAGIDAFAARAALADAASHTLDLQYYIVRNDDTTWLLLGRVLRAAERGVRVRLLVDDLDALGKDPDLAVLGSLPHVEVRVFNPFATRGAFGLGHLLEVLGDTRRLNRRMHNKLWIADNAMAVIGGRNLGDEYFDAAGEVNFTDLDLLVAGPAVRTMSDSFDAFWNSRWSLPIHALAPELPTEAARTELQRRLQRQAEAFRRSAYAQSLREAQLGRTLRTGLLKLKPAPVEVVFDDPAKIDEPEDPGAPAASLFGARLRPLMAAARQELILVSPYFIPSEAGIAGLAALVQRGVRVRVLTNSLASADAVPLAHAGYARRRKALVDAGIELHEMRPDGTRQPRARGLRASGAYLHTKAIVVDRRHLVVGSMNLDPRSRLSNTELGLLIDSPPLAAQLTALFDEAVAPSRAFRVMRAEGGDASAPLVWHTEDDGRPVQHPHEPLTSVWRRALSRLLQAIAPEELL